MRTANETLAPRDDSQLIQADAFSIHTPRGLVFHPQTFSIPHGSAVAVMGRPDSGKSSLLLALTGRMRGATGELIVAGQDAIRHPGRVRKLSSVARIDALIEPEPTLSLEDSITERTLADAAAPKARFANYFHVAQLLGLEAPRPTLVGALTPADQIKAALALALIKPAQLVVLDDIDRGTTLKEQETLWHGITQLAAEGVTIIATTAEASAIPTTALTLDLEPKHA